MKKIYTKQLFVVMFALLCSVAANAHDFEVDGVYYNINGDEAIVTFKGKSYFSVANEYSGNVVMDNVPAF